MPPIRTLASRSTMPHSTPVPNESDLPSVSDTPELADLSREYRRRLKISFRYNFPSVGKWADGRALQSSDNMDVHHTQFSLRTAIDTLSKSNQGGVFDQDIQRTLSQQCVLAAYQNGVWYDAEGVKLLHYFPHLYSAKTLSPILEELHKLLGQFPLNKQHNDEQGSAKYEEWAKHLGPDVPTGIIRMTYDYQEDHPSKAPAPSDDFLANSLAAMYFRKSATIRDLSDRMSILLASIDPVQWRRYRDAYTAMADKFLLLQECNFDFKGGKRHIHCFMGVHLVVNWLATMDGEDPPDGWVAMLVFGDFRDGNLCFPDLGVTLPFQVGDVVFMRSSALKQFILPYVGKERHVLVFSTNKSIFDWLERQDTQRA
jgi:hypothetical protein